MSALLPCGERAVLIELADLDEVLALDGIIRALAEEGSAPWSAIEDVVPAALTVLVTVRSAAALPGVREGLASLLGAQALQRALLPSTRRAAETDAIEIPVVYDGPDLDEVARLTRLSVDDVIAAHTSRPWRVAFGGFAPGFSYLVDGDPRLQVPRRDEPRTTVPAGAVGLAGAFSGIYPRSSPGGWQLLGHTDTVLWDADREPPALLQPGAHVRFVRADSPDDRAPSADPAVRGGPARPHPDAPLVTGRAVEVVATGPLALLQDLGRPGYGAVGVTRSGAADRAAHALANRLVGNPDDRATIEGTFGGLTLRASGHLHVAVTGAPSPVSVDGVPAPVNAPFYLPPGATLKLGLPAAGLRSYLAVAGGFDVPQVLGSRSTDTMSGLGPAKLTVGALLPIGDGPLDPTSVDSAPASAPTNEPLVLDVVPGPRDAWLADLHRLAETTWTVSQRSDRVGVRLEGEPLQRAPEHEGRELQSEGVVRGSIQVPSNGQPVIFLADHPVTGGYPVAAVVADADTDRLAQARPGQQVRLRLR
ncbi:5-oxoprolinase subunit B/C family protein [Nigerium massiliense]|uniref:5-oxoprolinase subunit B/C family protein n=1 Tax=Nigerium massiliense TaxID=1522317 RepID=UPI000693B725|nr:5-oxoprolinase/urea amidolyase family protein [Nigerium massiliense]